MEATLSTSVIKVAMSCCDTNLLMRSRLSTSKCQIEAITQIGNTRHSSNRFLISCMSSSIEDACLGMIQSGTEATVSSSSAAAATPTTLEILLPMSTEERAKKGI